MNPLDQIRIATPETVVVFGGLGGIGSAICQRYFKSGLRVVACDVSEDCALISKEMRNSPMFFHVHVDVTSRADLENCFNDIHKRFGFIDHVVSLAGGAIAGEFNGIGKSTEGMIRQSISLNLISHLDIVSLSSAHIKKSDAENRSITLVSSINAFKDYGCVAYSAAKAGIVGIVKSSVSEFGVGGVRINAVVPGTVPTPRTLKQPKDFEKLKKSTVLNRFPEPADIADTVFCLSHILTSVTGESLVVDSGQSLKGGV